MAALAAFSAGILSGVTGFGLAVIVVPLLLLVYDPKTVVALTGVLSLTVAAAVGHDSWREADHRVALALLTAALPGLFGRTRRCCRSWILLTSSWGWVYWWSSAAHANKPKVKQEEIEPLDTSQAATFLKAAKGDRFEALYFLCLMCGLRQGEALALHWRDFDLDEGTLRVNLQLQRVRGGGGLQFSKPKNASRRTVGLPQRAVSALKSHRKRQAEEKLRVADYEDSGLVFASSKGTPIDAQNVVNRYYKPLLKRAGLPPIRFHDLRHSCLSLLAQRGEPIRDLQALAGHATAAFTLQRYTHHYDSSARRTADTMGEILSEQHEQAAQTNELG